jgi:probable rRNA maturation factor
MASNVALQIDARWERQVDTARLERAVSTTLESEGFASQPSLSIVIVGDEEMTRLHEAYRHEEGTTDVLSFPYDSETPDPDNEMAGYLGDIILCYPQAARQAADEGGHTTQDELDLLTVHGVLHLLGYDDETPAEQAQMWAHQARVMAKLALGHVAPRSHNH